MNSKNQEYYASSDPEILTFNDTTNEYCCVICSYRTPYKGNIKRHLQNHSGIKPFLCKFCPHRSANKSDLQKHLRTHTGEKPYICNFCQKAFTQGSSLNAHLRIHNY